MESDLEAPAGYLGGDDACSMNDLGSVVAGEGAGT